jgi:hypothetical protein
LNTSRTTLKSLRSTPTSSTRSEASLFEVKRNYDSVLLNLVLCKRHFLKRGKRCCPCVQKNCPEKVSHSMSRVDVGFQRNH